MSEEFDKEAEREKLREKFEKDAEKRQETQRMSELLLQGATMTNEHCDRCGDPLFRDGERTFCPTCSGADEVEEQAAEQQPESQPAVQEAEQPQSEQSQPEQPRTEQSQPQQAESQQPQPEQRQPTRAATAPQQAGPVDAPTPTEQIPEPASTPDGDGPRAELQRAVTRSARKANEATDPRTAKQWLEASKEAAEALEALER